MNKLIISIPVLIYLLITVFVAYIVNKKNKDGSFINRYYIGNRTMGAFVLSMTIVSTYIGASSFIGGPSLAYNYGLSWVLLACIQIPVVFLTLGILGKKMAIISRKLNIVTVVELIKARYKNDILVVLISILLLVFLVASIIAQLVGGARLFESILNIDYKIALSIFAIIVIFYTTIGGFKAVTITDAIQGLIMMISTVVLFIVIVNKAGGMFNLMQSVKEVDVKLITPNANGEIARPFIMSFWLLVGVGILGLPATLVRTMGYKDSKSLHRAMLIGTFVVGFLIIGMHLIGVMGRALDTNLDVSDKLIPILAMKYLPPILVGIFIGGPLAAIMSTVDSLLIIASSSIVKDIYLNYINKKVDDGKLKKISLFSSLTIGLLTYILALNPPSLIVWINLFSLGGQEVLFFIPIILGLYWKRGNDKGALSSVILGFLVYMYLNINSVSILGLNNVVPSIFISLFIYIVVSLLTQKPDDEVLEMFFNEKKS